MGRFKPIIVIAGPTASGKTQLSLDLARACGGEVVSADSVQVYREMNIGTAKVGLEERGSIPHHLIDICNLSTNYNVVHFYNAAQESFKEILSRGNVPIVVGGSGFYIHALLYGSPTGPSDPLVRQELEKEMQDFGHDVLYEKLEKQDPEYALTISRRDRHKIIRSLEIIALSQHKMSDFYLAKQQEYDFRCWFIYYDRNFLYPRINARCDQMILEGLLEEVRELENRGLRKNLSASQAIGYRQALEYLDGFQNQEELDRFTNKFKIISRRFAKKQFTWFRKEPLFRWVDRGIYSSDSIITMILKDLAR